MRRTAAGWSSGFGISVLIPIRFRHLGRGDPETPWNRTVTSGFKFTLTKVLYAQFSHPD